ncbi:Stage V sporulation protein D [Poriferisphaera corsica]|uniref:beta-lactamase n=1 Tax=Poriferisphaera corsica TaxID=2528020 RepID=A0A517YUR6_9BACT|nr:penicillin-binding transpeptidase domain-containing protein [Poriferisphaera corsica]QDU33957.1 Stage V sporulation protein D [Poriferisphaera corsica]
MRRALRQLIPSMFHRRLLLLGVLVCAIFFILMARAISLGSGESKQIAIDQTQRSLETTTLVPTVRGRILDRNGFTIARDVSGFDLALSYQLLSREWEINKAKDATSFYIKYVADPNNYGLSKKDEIDIYNQQLERFQQYLDRLWYDLSTLANLPKDELESRRTAILARLQKNTSNIMRRREYVLEKKWNQEITWREAEVQTAEETAYYKHTVLENIPEHMQATIRSLAAEAELAKYAYEEAKREDSSDLLDKRLEYEELQIWSELKIQRPRRREYPHETQQLTLDRSTLPIPIRADATEDITVSGVGLHIVGNLRNTSSTDIKRKPFRKSDGQIDWWGYSANNDSAGLTGIEATMEDTLRGKRGYQIKELGEVVEEQQPLRGKDVRLSLDILLQGRIQALLSPQYGFFQVQQWHKFDDYPQPKGTPLAGSVVVLDIETSEILAAVSAPNYSLEQWRDPIKRKQILEDYYNLPTRFRPIAQPYAPGSTVKPLIYAAAVTDGIIGATESIYCNGVFNKDRPEQFRCWIHKQFMSEHKNRTGVTALAVSCNIYFYTLGQRFGVVNIVNWFKRFGLGEKPNTLVNGETAGGLPDLSKNYSVSDAINMGIGQGPMSWSPVQAAGAYAALARGGEYISPTFVVPEDRPKDKPQTTRSLGLKSTAYKTALMGLHSVVNTNEGGGHTLVYDDASGQQVREKIFDQPDLDIAGKTGTAQSWHQRQPIYDENGKIAGWGEILKRGDHGWFISLVKRKDDRDYKYVVLAVTDYGGSGGRASGPIVNQVLHAMKAEGYLTGKRRNTKDEMNQQGGNH